MDSKRKLIRSAGTSVVALFLIAGAAFATSAFVGSARQVDSAPAGASSSESPEASDELGTEDATGAPEATDELETEEPSETPEVGEDATGAPEATGELETEDATDDHGGDD